MTEKNNRITEIQFHNKVTVYSFVIMMAVVMIHAFNLEVYGYANASSAIGLASFVYWTENIVGTICGGTAVPFFFLLSGFLMFRNFTWDKLASKYRSRFFSILLPYLLWCSIYYLYYVIVTRIPIVLNMMNGTEKMPVSLAVWISKLWVDEYFVFWFLKDLIVLIILTPLIYLLLQNRGKLPVGLLMLVLWYAASRYYTIPFNIAYMFGAYIGINHKEIPMKKHGAWVTVMSYIGLGLWIMTIILQKLSMIDGGMPILVVLICLWYAGDVLSYDKEPYWWMKISFFIYCTHDMILEAYEKIFLKVFGISPICAILDYVLMPAVTVVTVIGMAAIMKKYFPRLWMILTGGRG